MKPLHLLVATVVAALLCVGAVPTTEAKEVRKPDIARYAEYAKSSVRIQRRVDDKPKTFGNGVVVRKGVLTAAHVVMDMVTKKANEGIVVIGHDGKEYPVPAHKIAFVAGSADLAELYVKLPYPALPLGKAGIGTAVMVGIWGPGHQTGAIFVTMGQIVKRDWPAIAPKWFVDNYIATGLPGAPGASGSPLIQNGRVVGVLSRGWSGPPYPTMTALFQRAVLD